MASDEKRLNIDGLVPGEKYAIQVRAVDNGEPSDWSQKYHIETIDDTAGGTRTPTPPSLTSFVVDASGQYLATWNTVTTNTDGSPMVVNRYELQLETANFGTAVVPHYGQSGGVQTRSFNFGHLRSMFAGNIPTSITARLRVVNSAGTISPWSDPLTASLPVPNPPRNPVAVGAIDAIKVSWDPPLDPIHLFGYRVYLSMTDENFVPDTLSRSNLIYEGTSTEFTHTTLGYDFVHWFKIVSYSEPGLESSWVEANAKPKSPYGPDDTPPEVPVFAFGTPGLDRSVLTAPKANVSWTMPNPAAEVNEDIAGFAVRWRRVGESTWRSNYFDKNTFSAIIDLPQPFSNYEFGVSAFDFVGNYSAYSETQNLTGALAAPAQTTGVDSIPRFDGMRIIWDKSSSQSVEYGGLYEIQYKTTNSFTDDVPNATTANTFLDLTGLAELSTWYYRVRAKDSAGQYGAWSVVDSVTLPPFPVAAETDGVAPSAAPQNPRATAGLNYINVSWDRVTNPDPVWYEVFASTTSGFTTYDSTTFVGESSGTSLMVNRLANGTVLQQSTPYYFKVRVMDKDCLEPGVNGPVSAQTTAATLTQVLANDLGIDMGGENLLYNSSFETDSDGNNVGDYWEIVNTTSGAEPTTPSRITGRDSIGFAQRVDWTGTNTGTKGIRSVNSPVIRPNTEYMYSFYALSNGSGFTLTASPALTSVTPDPDNQTPSTSVWKRYIFKVVTGATVDPKNITIVNTNTVSNGWFAVDDAQLEAGNTATAYKTGTVSIAKLATGKFTAADMVISTGGRITSEAYLANSNTGFSITDAGITIRDGQIDAKTLVANSTITNSLFIGALLEVAAGGSMRSANYSDGSSTPAAGFRIDSVGIDIRTGSINVGTLKGGSITSTSIAIGTGGTLTIDSTGSIQSNNWNAAGPTGWKISSTGITMDANSSVHVNAIESGTLTSTQITLGSGGEIRSNGWASAAAIRWQLAETGLTMIGGTITGATIVTNQLKSAVSEMVDGTVRYRFSIDNDGYAEFVGARIYGNAIVGSSSSNLVRSGTYNGVNGWELRGDGNARFYRMEAFSAQIYGSTVVGAGGNVLQSAGFVDQSAGWRLTGDGDAQFNGGSMRVGSGSAGQVWMRVADGGSTAQIRFYKPGDATNFSTISALGDNTFEMRGAYGGLVSLRAPWFTGRTHVVIAQDAYVTGEIRVDNGITTEFGGLNVKSGGVGLDGGLTVRSGGFYVNGGVTMTVMSGSANNKFVMVTPGGGLYKGVNEGSLTSTIKSKKNVEPLNIKTESILALEPKQFHMKYQDESRVNKQAGFIAEEAEELGLKQWVSYADNGDIEGFYYMGFVAAHQQVLREHQDKIEALEAEVKKLSQRA